MSSIKYRFGQFVLDLSRHELTRGGKTVHLERIPMSLLVLLVRENGRLIQRDEIIAQLWGSGLHFDTDNSINTAIRKIRHALGDDPGDPRYVETVLGKGYRLKIRAVASVTQDDEIVADKSRIMLAVLPFENLSGDPTQEYFSDGLSEETIMRLGQISPREMGVIARTSSMAYKKTRKSVAQIGQELGVDYVIEGSVRREGDRIRVTAQLIRVTDQIHLWAEKYDRQLPGMLDLHGEIGAAIAAQVRLKLMGGEQRQFFQSATHDSVAYDQYLRGRYHLARYNLEDAERAAAHFRAATEHDHLFALAFSGLADALIVLPISGDAESKGVFGKVKPAVQEALRLDFSSAEAHTADSWTKFWFEWDFQSAETAARHAIQLNENYALAHMCLSHVLSNVGRHEEALAVIQHAAVLDPLSLIVAAMRGQFLYQAGRDTESLERFKALLAMESRFWIGQICAAKTFEKLRMYDEALESCYQAWQYSGGNSEATSIAGYVHAVSGNRAAAEASIHEMLEQRKQRYVPPYNIALVFAGLRDSESALKYLQQAFEERDVHMTFLLDHKWECLRSNAQFRRLLSQVGLAVT